MIVYRARACTTHHFDFFAILALFYVLDLVFDALHAAACVANAGPRCAKPVVHAVEM